MSQLARMLDYIRTSDGQERERKLSKIAHVVEVRVGAGEADRVRKLLMGEGSDSTTLIQEEVHKTILEGAEPAQCMRNVLPTITCKTSSLRYVTGGTAGYADEVSEGAEIPIHNTSFSKTDFVIKKIGVRPVITRELVEDGLFDAVEHELRKSGVRMENKLNRDALAAVIGTSAQNQNASTDDLAHVTDLTDARAKICSANFHPDKFVMHPEYEGSLLKDTNLVYANYAGGSEALRKGTVGTTLVGLKPYVCGVTTANGSWDFSGTAGDVGAVVLDSLNAGAIAIRQDIKVEEYDDVIHDLVGMAITMRYDVKALENYAACKISCQ